MFAELTSSSGMSQRRVVAGAIEQAAAGGLAFGPGWEVSEAALADALAETLLACRGPAAKLVSLCSWSGPVGRSAVSVEELEPEAVAAAIAAAAESFLDRVNTHTDTRPRVDPPSPCLNGALTAGGFGGFGWLQGGLVLLVYSAVLTRSLEVVAADLAGSLAEPPLVVGPNKLCSMELVSMLLCGSAAMNVRAFTDVTIPRRNASATRPAVAHQFGVGATLPGPLCTDSLVAQLSSYPVAAHRSGPRRLAGRPVRRTWLRSGCSRTRSSSQPSRSKTGSSRRPAVRTQHVLTHTMRPSSVAPRSPAAS